MCGIAGVWHAGVGMNVGSTAMAMANRMVHRGPDDSGVWSDSAAGVALGFRRLAIVDLSPNGHQPMVSRSGRYQIVFNGEVYNYRELSAELARDGSTFRGHSDTEVVLAAFERWGIRSAVERFVGMFAMAVWDSAERTLILIRDRLGIKPLFIYQNGETVAFASELKAFSDVPGFTKEIDTTALAAYLRHLYVPAPMSIFRHVRKLPPGHIQTLQSPHHAAQPVPYWSLQSAATLGQSDLITDDAEGVDALDAALSDAVRLRMRADVPLGAFLSGGIDSATIVALMQEASSRPVQTFTVGFDVGVHDESDHAAALASYIGTDHQTFTLTGSDAVELIPNLARMFDEPLADPSQLPTYLICAAARQSVTVAVSGDGGDELFAGYNRHRFGTRIIAPAEGIPLGVRRMIGRGLTTVPPATWDRFHRSTSRVLRVPPGRLIGDKVHKFGQMLKYSSASDMYISLMSAWDAVPMHGSDGVDPIASDILARPDIGILQRMILADQHSYLADDLLAKVDRASMAVSLEVRVPILDHRVVELSWRMPDHFKIRHGVGKWVLRQVLQRRVPKALVERPKVGFSVPLVEWFRGPLSDWASDILHDPSLENVPQLDVARIRREWVQFQAGQTNNALRFWAVLMLHDWVAEWRTT